MNCNKCKSELPQDVKYCIYCGQELGMVDQASPTSQTPVAPPTPPSPTSRPTMPSVQYSGTLPFIEGTPMRHAEEINKMFSSKLFLACMIILSVATFGLLIDIGVFVGAENILGMVEGLLAGLTAISLNILVLVGGWMIYYTAGKGGVSQAALTLLKVVQIVYMVFIFVLLVIVVYFAIVMTATNGFLAVLGILIFIPATILLLGVFAAVTSYSVVGIFAIKTISKNLKSTEMSTKYIDAFAILNMIGGLLFLSAFMTALQENWLYSIIGMEEPLAQINDLLTLPVPILFATSMVLLGYILIRLKRNMIKATS